jgi:hypothetical protein
MSSQQENPLEVLHRLAADGKTVLVFFAFFSRFEYALKRSGFLVKNKDEASPDWDAFANDLRGRLDAITDPCFRDAVAFLQNEPPRKQVLVGGAPDWAENPRATGEHHENYLLRLVRTIRNNLFHGGKYGSAPVADDARNSKLLAAGVTVLSHCLALSPEVEAVFKETA